MRFDEAVDIFESLFRGLFSLLVVTGMAWFFLGVQVLSGFLFLVVLVFYYFATSSVSTCFRTKIAESADERLSLMKAIVYGIRTVKMHAWEWPFMETIQNIRRY